MRIDPTPTTATSVQVVGKTGATLPVQTQRKASTDVADRLSVQHQAAPVRQTASTRTAPLPEPSQLSVSLDDRQNIIYRFTDPNSGELRRQVPPEEILRVMRNIEDLLHESGQKLKVTT